MPSSDVRGVSSAQTSSLPCGSSSSVQALEADCRRPAASTQQVHDNNTAQRPQRPLRGRRADTDDVAAAKWVVSLLLQRLKQSGSSPEPVRSKTNAVHASHRSATARYRNVTETVARFVTLPSRKLSTFSFCCSDLQALNTLAVRL